MSQLLPVTQADRDAVQAFHRVMAARIMSDIASERPKLGEDEGDAGTLVQAFARHRIAASASPDIDHHQTNVMAPVEIGPVTPVEGLSGEGIAIDGILLPPGVVDDEAYMEGWLDGQTYLLLNQRTASPATPAGSVREALAFGRQYFERGFIAAYAWAATKLPSTQISDAVIDRAWDHRDEGMDEGDILPTALHPVDSRAQGGEK